MVTAVSWPAGGSPAPNRPTQPAWNWTLPGASRAVTFAERQRRPLAEPVTAAGEEGTMNTMLNQVADGVWVRQSGWVWSNAIAVRGKGGLTLVDPGIDGSDLNQLADDLDQLGIAV